MTATVIDACRALMVFRVVGMLLAGCIGSGKVAIDIGPHRGSLHSPAGWAFFDQGKKWELREGEASIVLHDLGPSSPTAFGGKLRDSWRCGRPAIREPHRLG